MHIINCHSSIKEYELKAISPLYMILAIMCSRVHSKRQTTISSNSDSHSSAINLRDNKCRKNGFSLYSHGDTGSLVHSERVIGKKIVLTPAPGFISRVWELARYESSAISAFNGVFTSATVMRACYLPTVFMRF